MSLLGLYEGSEDPRTEQTESSRSCRALEAMVRDLDFEQEETII